MTTPEIFLTSAWVGPFAGSNAIKSVGDFSESKEEKDDAWGIFAKYAGKDQNRANDTK